MASSLENPIFIGEERRFADLMQQAWRHGSYPKSYRFTSKRHISAIDNVFKQGFNALML
ncbi:hypothetical protein HSX11_29130 [Oxalobacteraceae bacterium]|nr:hypothetical protein [Oxalobacteraceae bacterium]